jgi:maltose alpha-D-glucosyltransferase/alpha-amylase
MLERSPGTGLSPQRSAHPASTSTPQHPQSEAIMYGDRWYKNAVIYCCSVGTFMDSDGDGVGDFQGLSSRLDYLQGLGITAIWLMPFQPSPRKDDGYDITDYYNVDPRYGTLGDFVEFTHGAALRGIRVIIDFVANHTSDQHPWFRSARRGPDSPYYDWYVWADRKPPDANKGMVFPGVQKSTWTRVADIRKYYFHRFYEHQPDLNTSNPKVQAEILRIMGFWIQLGVAGFRMDAVPFVVQKKGSDVGRHKPKYDLLRVFREFSQWRMGETVILAEANVLPDESANYFGKHGERLQMMFNFHVNQHLFYALASGDIRPLVAAIARTGKVPANAQWALHLRNHDELDLGRLTRDQRETVLRAFGPERQMQLYGRGIRRRLGPMFNGDRRLVELANSLLFTLPGTPVVRYGDEIGMGDDLSLPERYSTRTPMQWTSETNGGFTLAEEPVLPVISGGEYGYQHLNVASQRREPDSLLNWFERIMRMRKEVPEIGCGRHTVIDVGNTAVLAMRYDWRDSSVLFMHNLADVSHEVFFRTGIDDAKGAQLVDLLGHEHSHAAEDGRHCVLLEAYGYRWFRIGDLDYQLTQGTL